MNLSVLLDADRSHYRLDCDSDRHPATRPSIDRCGSHITRRNLLHVSVGMTDADRRDAPAQLAASIKGA